jgi:uncharacterized membrane protein YqgA involved in biofilm formation
MGVGAWVAVKLSQKILRAFYFAIFTAVGGVLVLVLSLAKSGNIPNTPTWIAGALAFGVVASAIRKKIVRAITLAALAAGIYMVLKGQAIGPIAGSMH